jgi:hypothetical protein
VTVDNFAERMRERMPAHRVWKDARMAPGLSRSAQNLMWEEMRARLRAYEQQRRLEAQRRFRSRWQRLRRSINRPLAALLFGAGLLLFAIGQLFR